MSWLAIVNIVGRRRAQGDSLIESVSQLVSVNQLINQSVSLSISRFLTTHKRCQIDSLTVQQVEKWNTKYVEHRQEARFLCEFIVIMSNVIYLNWIR